MNSSPIVNLSARLHTEASNQLIEANKNLESRFADIPGTVLFDKTQSRLGYELNMFCMSLMKDANRQSFRADAATYMAQFAMSEQQRDAVLARDYNRMIALGGNIYFLAKIGASDGDSFQKLASKMTGVSEDEYRNMMIAGGRSIEGNRSIAANQSMEANQNVSQSVVTEKNG